MLSMAILLSIELKGSMANFTGNALTTFHVIKGSCFSFNKSMVMVFNSKLKFSIDSLNQSVKPVEPAKPFLKSSWSIWFLQVVYA